MAEDKIVTINLNLCFTRRTALLLLALLFLVWHPAYIGSESFTLTTYYPAPYGGYVSIMTTGVTILAKDGGNVGIGTASPTAKLDVAGSFRLADGNQTLGHVLTSDALGNATWQPPTAGTVGPHVYQCPSGTGSLGGGAWGYYGCQGQITTLSYCQTIEYPSWANYSCTYIGRLLLQ
ncbi:MAG: hypothetical protein NDI60_05130 [Elusimicrobiales bacterium]|nr:hypothetical protein [Elusimicrobiales bacterium]